jgi:phosphoadenosine phosphosulfate reductase
MAQLKDLFGHDKVEEAIERIKMFEPPEGYYFADSGGKDSSVVRELLLTSGCKFDAHYSVTTIDPPELIYFLRQHHSDTK